MKRILTLTLAAALAVSMLAPCGSSRDPATGTTPAGDTTANGETVEGGVAQVISVALESDPDTLDPGRADDSTKNQIVLEVQETLVRLVDGVLEPAGAESWDVSDDGLVWTLNLRDNQYNDGTAVVADDYVNSFRRIFDPEVNCHNASIFYCIAGGEAFNTGEGTGEEVGVVALDDKTLEITLAEPLPYFMQLLSFGNTAPVPASKTEGAANATHGASAGEMVYSGPFYMDSWTRGSGIVLKKNPNYWDADSVKLEEINFVLAVDQNTRQQLFDQGQTHILRTANVEYLGQIQSKIDDGEIALYGGDQPTSHYICFNNEDPEGVFTNAKIRKAFSLAFDREAYVANVSKKNRAAMGWIPYGLNNGNTIFRDTVEEPLKSLLSEDPKALLEEGLKEIGMEGRELTVTFLQRSADNDYKLQAEYFQNQWQNNLGVTVKIDTASDSASFNQQVSKGMYQICQTGWGGDYNDPMTFMQMFMSGDGNNAPYFSNARFDELIEACKLEGDMDARLKNFTEAEQILVADEAAIAPLMFGHEQNVATSKLKNFVFNGAGGPQIEFKNAYLEA